MYNHYKDNSLDKNDFKNDSEGILHYNIADFDKNDSDGNEGKYYYI